MNSWVGVDLDCTLAKYDKWRGAEHIGEPISEIVELVKELLTLGIDVRIFTARVAHETEGVVAELAIGDWTEEIFGKRLPVTNIKDMQMICVIDDRSIQVEPNTGKIIGSLDQIKELKGKLKNG